MTIPTEPLPPDTVGSAPRNAQEVNGLVGLHLRDFMRNKMVINQDQEWFATVDLTTVPYSFSADQQTLIKSCFADLDTALDAINTTFISRLIGMG